VGDPGDPGLPRAADWQAALDVRATPIAVGRIEGVATAAFLYTDIDLPSSNAQAEDTVKDEVRIELGLAAEAVQ
jgi:hypothetical protein